MIRKQLSANNDESLIVTSKTITHQCPACSEQVNAGVIKLCDDCEYERKARRENI